MYCTKCGARIEESASFCPSCGQPVVSPQGESRPASPVLPAMSPPAPAVPEPAAIRTAYAGFWLRLVAWIIDSLIVSAAFLIVLVPFMSVFLRHRPFESPMPGPATAIFMLWFWAVNLFGVWLYYALFESSSWQGTPGKRALGLFVTDMQGRRISFARATGRYFGRFISTAILFIGYLMIAFTERKQALHDMLADCLVLRRL